MAVTALNNIKNWFKTGLKPTQNQFWDTWDSFFHKGEKIPVASIEGIDDLLQSKVSSTHLNDANAHTDLFNNKLDKGGYTGNAKTLSDRIEAIKYPDALLSSVPPTRVGNLVTFPASMYIARINQTQVLNAVYSTTITAATDNYHRTDLIELRSDGTLNKKVGAESLTAAVKPSLSVNAVEVTTIDVFGSVVSDPSTPFDGSSFLPKGGYKGTAQDLANGMSDLNAANLKFGGYPSTRNDGQIPTNRVLGTDASGNLKMYTIATAPAPYLDELIPDSYLPSTTGNFILKGSFFTPNMIVTIPGQTINYTNFISDNEFHVNVTTGSAEGYFDVTLNNGISKTFSKVLLLVLGTVYSPVASEWTVTGNVDVSVDKDVSSTVYKSQGTAIWSKTIDYTKNFRIEWNFRRSPLGMLQENPIIYNYFSIVKVSNGVHSIMLKPYSDTRNRTGYSFNNVATNNDYFYYHDNPYSTEYELIYMETITMSIRWVKGVLYVYMNNVLYSTLTDVLTENHKIKIGVWSSDYANIKYIETA